MQDDLKDFLKERLANGIEKIIDEKGVEALAEIIFNNTSVRNVTDILAEINDKKGRLH